jgi:hypothetical protein
MRITRRPATTIPGLGELPAADGADGAAAAAGRPVTDRVELSEAARLRQRLRAEVGGPDAAADARIAGLRAEVERQTYAPSPRAVAERLLAELAADLLA